MLKDISDRKTQEGTFKFHVNQACGDQVRIMKRCLGMFEDQEFLTHLGFLHPSQVTSPTALREDQCVADYIWDLMRHMVNNEILTAAFYRDRPPFAFYGTAWRVTRWC